MSYLIGLAAGAFLAGTTTGRALARFGMFLVFIALAVLGLLNVTRSL